MTLQKRVPYLQHFIIYIFIKETFCPQTLKTLNHHQFKKVERFNAIINVVYPKDPMISQAVFKVFDTDCSGTMDFSEYIQAKQALKLNTLEEKLGWIFCVFDSDGGGTIDICEIEEIVVGIFDFAGIKADEKILEACIKDVKDTLDADDDGTITKEEFVKHAVKSKFINNMFLKE